MKKGKDLNMKINKLMSAVFAFAVAVACIALPAAATIAYDVNKTYANPPADTVAWYKSNGPCGDPWVSLALVKVYGKADQSDSAKCNVSLYNGGKWSDFNQLVHAVGKVKNAGTATAPVAAKSDKCTDQWVTNALKDLNLTENYANCQVSQYNGGKWSSYDELVTAVAKKHNMSFECPDLWVSEALRKFNITVTKTKCDVKLYNGGTWKSKDELTAAVAKKYGKTWTAPAPVAAKSDKCTDQWVANALKDLNLTENYANCQVAQYNGGKWSSYEELVTAVAKKHNMSFECPDLWVSEALRKFNVTVTKTKCDVKLYNGGTWKSKDELTAAVAKKYGKTWTAPAPVTAVASANVKPTNTNSLIQDAGVYVKPKDTTGVIGQNGANVNPTNKGNATIVGPNGSRLFSDQGAGLVSSNSNVKPTNTNSLIQDAGVYVTKPKDTTGVIGQNGANVSPTVNAYKVTTTPSSSSATIIDMSATKYKCSKPSGASPLICTIFSGNNVEIGEVKARRFKAKLSQNINEFKLGNNNSQLLKNDSTGLRAIEDKVEGAPTSSQSGSEVSGITYFSELRAKTKGTGSAGTGSAGTTGTTGATAPTAQFCKKMLQEVGHCPSNCISCL